MLGFKKVKPTVISHNHNADPAFGGLVKATQELINKLGIYDFEQQQQQNQM